MHQQNEFLATPLGWP